MDIFLSKYIIQVKKMNKEFNNGFIAGVSLTKTSGVSANVLANAPLNREILMDSGWEEKSRMLYDGIESNAAVFLNQDFQQGFITGVTLMQTVGAMPKKTPAERVRALLRFDKSPISDDSVYHYPVGGKLPAIDHSVYLTGGGSARFVMGTVMTLGTNQDFNFGTAEFAIECCLYTISPETRQTLFLKMDAAEGSRFVTFELLDGCLAASAGNTSNIFHYTSAEKVPGNTWVRVMLKKENNDFSLYLNNRKCTVDAAHAWHKAYDKATGMPVITNAPAYLSISQRPILGYLDEYKITVG